MSVYILGVRSGSTAGSGSTGTVTKAPASWSNAKLISSAGEVSLTSDSLDILEEFTGLGPAPRTVNFDVPLGLPGSVPVAARPVRDEQRTISGALYVRGDTPRDRADIMSQALQVLCPPDDSQVRFQLSRGEDLVYTDGYAEFDTGDWEATAAWDHIAILGMTMQCPSPYWSGTLRTLTLGQSTAGAFFPVFPLGLAPASALGAASTITTSGDVPTWPTVTWTGPGTALEFETSAGTWRIEGTVAGGEVVTVRLDPLSGLAGDLRVEGPDGSSWWSNLVQRGLRPLAPGTETATITVEGLGAATTVEVAWRPLWRDVP